jgi:Fur family ferric uptake transcriptional regulator
MCPEELSEADSSRWLDLAYRRIASAGLRSGSARSAVVELLAKEGNCLLSAQEVTDLLRDLGTGGSPASVYRSLEQLHELGLLHKLTGSDGISRFEVALPDHHHHHFFDEQTGETIAFEDDDLETAVSRIGRRLGVEITSHDVILRGRRKED